MTLILEKFCCCKLETGGLIFGIAAFLQSVFQVIFGLFVYEDFYDVNSRLKINNSATEHTIQFVYVVLAITDILSSTLLIIGILKKNKFLLLPWIVNTGLELVLTLWDYFNPLVPCLFIAAVFGGICFVWYSIVSLFVKFKQEEEANTGVQMAYIDETPSQLPPYNMLSVSK